MTSPNVQVQTKRIEFPTPLPTDEAMSQFNSIKDLDERKRQKNALSRHWYSLLEKYGWEVLNANKHLKPDVVTRNAVPKTNQEGKKFFDFIRSRPPCKSVKIWYPKNLSQGELWAIALPDWAIYEGSPFLAISIELPDQLDKNNQFDFEMVPCIIIRKKNSIADIVLDISNVNPKDVPTKEPYRQGDAEKKNSAVENGGMTSSEEPTAFTADG